jgi:titin
MATSVWNDPGAWLKLISDDREQSKTYSMLQAHSSLFDLIFCAVFPDVPSALPAPHVGSIFRDSCVVTWAPPTSDGGSPVTGYHLEQRVVGRPNWLRVGTGAQTTGASGTSFRVGGLFDGQSYQFRVASENRVGLSEWSPASTPIVARDPWEKPGRPGAVQVSDITRRSCRLSWIPPASDGGDEISGYVVEYKVNRSIY